MTYNLFEPSKAPASAGPWWSVQGHHYEQHNLWDSRLMFSWQELFSPFLEKPSKTTSTAEQGISL